MFKEGEIVYVNDEKLSPYLVGKFVGYFGSQNNILQFDVIVKGKNRKPQKKIHSIHERRGKEVCNSWQCIMVT